MARCVTEIKMKERTSERKKGRMKERENNIDEK